MFRRAVRQDCVAEFFTCSRGSELFDRIVHLFSWGRAVRQVVVRQIPSGLKALYRANILHKDLHCCCSNQHYLYNEVNSHNMDQQPNVNEQEVDDVCILQSRQFNVHGGNVHEVPRLGMEFDLEQHAFDYYSEYAHRVGFSVRKQHVKKKDGIVTRTLYCSKQGERVLKLQPTRNLPDHGPSNSSPPREQVNNPVVQLAPTRTGEQFCDTILSNSSPEDGKTCATPSARSQSTCRNKLRPPFRVLLPHNPIE
ncbi:hypothetical protein RJ639_009455 [Escallonia herrerae]|uniref:FAR1 domain-containing protein n=1 Tax=Escallonia herrerae TaxID=1293975 RepID=A0AA89AQV8_9ASTE|nr:hypothetical protein RJ639_009455 [Escallonia herrerae]